MPRGLMVLLMVFGCVGSRDCQDFWFPPQRKRNFRDENVPSPPPTSKSKHQPPAPSARSVKAKPETSGDRRVSGTRSKSQTRRKHKPVFLQAQREQRIQDRKDMEAVIKEDPDAVRGKMFAWQKFDATMVKRID